MRKYSVICYAIHNKKIASHDEFEDYVEACDFLQKEVVNIYEEEMNRSVNVDIEVNGNNNTAKVSSDECYWTWELIEIDC